MLCADDVALVRMVCIVNEEPDCFLRPCEAAVQLRLGGELTYKLEVWSHVLCTDNVASVSMVCVINEALDCFLEPCDAAGQECLNLKPELLVVGESVNDNGQ